MPIFGTNSRQPNMGLGPNVQNAIAQAAAGQQGANVIPSRGQPQQQASGGGAMSPLNPLSGFSNLQSGLNNLQGASGIIGLANQGAVQDNRDRAAAQQNAAAQLNSNYLGDNQQALANYANLMAQGSIQSDALSQIMGGLGGMFGGLFGGGMPMNNSGGGGGFGYDIDLSNIPEMIDDPTGRTIERPGARGPVGWVGEGSSAPAQVRNPMYDMLAGYQAFQPAGGGQSGNNGGNGQTQSVGMGGGAVQMLSQPLYNWMRQQQPPPGLTAEGMFDTPINRYNAGYNLPGAPPHPSGTGGTGGGGGAGNDVLPLLPNPQMGQPPQLENPTMALQDQSARFPYEETPGVITTAPEASGALAATGRPSAQSALDQHLANITRANQAASRTDLARTAAEAEGGIDNQYRDLVNQLNSYELNRYLSGLGQAGMSQDLLMQMFGGLGGLVGGLV